MKQTIIYKARIKESIELDLYKKSRKIENSFF